MLAVGPIAATYSDRIRRLLGYSIHPPFMGHIDGLHPLRRLDDTYDPSTAGAGAAAAEFFRSEPPHQSQVSPR